MPDRDPEKLPTIAVLVSGNGSNLQALMDAAARGELRGRIGVVVANRPSAHALVRAQSAGIPTRVLTLKPYRDAGRDREAYDADLARIVQEYNPDMIVLAGWMHILSRAFLRVFSGGGCEDGVKDGVKGSDKGSDKDGDKGSDKATTTKPVPIINLHPALPGAFDGARAIERAYEAFQRGEVTHTGVMVHEVTEIVDGGRVVAQQRVPIEQGDQLSDLETRIHAVEHALIVHATNLVLDRVSSVLHE